MGQPTLSDVHVNALLSNLSLAYLQEQDAFVAEQVFPTVPVQKQSDRYTVYSRADFNRNLMRKRAPATESAGNGYKVDTTPTYSADVWALHRDIDDQTRANADAIFNLDAEATRWLVTQALISREIDWAAKFFTTAIWTTDWAGTAAAGSVDSTHFLQWNDASSQPIVDIRNAKRAVQLASGGFRPNKLVIGRPVFDVLCDHPDFVDRIKYGQTPGKPAKVTLDAMAGLFEVNQVLVMDAIVNNGVEQAGPDSGGTDINAGESNAFIGNSGKSVLLTYTPDSPGIMTPASGLTFSWTGFYGATMAGTRIKSYYINQIESTRIEMDAAYAHKLVGKDMSAFFATAVA